MSNISPYKLLKIRGYENGAVINNKLQRLHGYQIEGSDCYFNDISYNYESLNRDLKEGTSIEFFYLSEKDNSLLDSLIHETDSPIVKQRLISMKNSGIRNVKKYIFLSTDDQSSSLSESPADFKYYENLLHGMNFSFTQMETEEVLTFMHKMCSLDDQIMISNSMTAREKTIQSQLSNESNYFHIGNYNVKVISLKSFPDFNRKYELNYILDKLSCNFMYVSSFETIKNQKKYDEIVKKRGKLYLSWANRKSSDLESSSLLVADQAKEYEDDQASKHSPVGWMSSKIIIWHKDKRELDKMTSLIINQMKILSYGYYEEKYMHHTEFFNSLPSTTTFSNRHHEKTFDFFLDSLPGGSRSMGDVDGSHPIALHSPFGGLHLFDPIVGRNNANMQIFGSSGSGKSMFTNLLIANIHTEYIRERNGKIMVLDNKGKTSSYKKMCDLFSGTFIMFDSKGTYKINPFPKLSEILDHKSKKFDKSEFTYILNILSIIYSVSNSDEGKYKRLIIERALKYLYKDLQINWPTFYDFADALVKVEIKEPSLQSVKENLKILSKEFLENPVNDLIKGKTTVNYKDSPFVVFDIQGLSELPSDLKSVVTFILMWEMKKTAFKLPISWIKSLFFDECAQIIVHDVFKDLITEMFMTARAFNVLITTITQNYCSFKQSGISDVINNCTTSKIFLSHADDEAARTLVSKDFNFTETQRKAFQSLHTVKGLGGYSRFLLITEKNGDIESYLIDTILSKADYWIGTSDPKDTAHLENIMKENSCSLLKAIELEVNHAA